MKNASPKESLILTPHEYGKRNADVEHVFPQSDNAGIWYPPKTLDEFMKLRQGAPEFNLRLQEKLFELMRRYEKEKWIVNGDTLYDSQRAHIEWATMSLCKGKQSPSSFLFIGPPGVGKTRLLAMIMQALIEMQIEDVLMEPIIFATAKLYHMTTKTVGTDYALKTMLHTAPLEAPPAHIAGIQSDLRKMFPGISKEFLTKKNWHECVADRSGTVEDIAARIRSLMGDAMSTTENVDDFLHTAAALIAGRGATVAGLDDTTRRPKLLEFDLQKDEGASLDHYAGEVACSIPKDYPVDAKGAWNVHREVNRNVDPKIFLRPVSVFSTSTGIQFLEAHGGKFSAALIDEALRKGGSDFLNHLKHAIVFALSTKNYGRLWDLISPQHSLRESIGVTLPNMRVDIFPSKEEPHYASESEKAVEQLIDRHFAHYPLLKKQPHLMDAVVAVHTQLTGLVGTMLEKRYAEMGIAAEVNRYDGKNGDSDPKVKSEKAILEAWFKQTGGKGPKILVTTPNVAADALDLPNMERLTIAKAVSPDVLYRLMGRPLHNNLHRTADDDYGVLICQQQFAGSQLGCTPFGVIEHGLPLNEMEGFRWVSGEILLSEEQHKIEARKIKTKGKKIPHTNVPGRKPADPKRNFIVIADGGTQYVVSNKQVIPTAKVIDFPNVFPEDTVVQQYLISIGQQKLLSCLGSLIVTAKKAKGDGKDWTKALIPHMESIQARFERMGSQ